jgi:hypothetical protein
MMNLYNKDHIANSKPYRDHYDDIRWDDNTNHKESLCENQSSNTVEPARERGN